MVFVGSFPLRVAKDRMPPPGESGSVATMRSIAPDGPVHLEGLCQPAKGAGGAPRRLRLGRGAPGIERLEAAFAGPAFAPHRHDTYAIGLTLGGVQTFRYRGEARHCLAGEVHVLHPDELHDGAAGTAEGFAYRILYIDPALVQEALGGRALPFVADPVIGRREAVPLLSWCLRDLDEAIDELGRLDITLAVTGLLERHAAGPRIRQRPLALDRLERVRDLIAADPAVQHPVQAFERAAGLDRWTLARQFRAAFGTSPTRFRTMRQLDRARQLMRAGMPLAAVALEAGFADQSHLSRLFKRTYGLTPSAWVAALA